MGQGQNFIIRVLLGHFFVARVQAGLGQLFLGLENFPQKIINSFWVKKSHRVWSKNTQVKRQVNWVFIYCRSEVWLGQGPPDRKKSHHFFEKGRFLVPNSKKLSFSNYYVNKTHKHLKWGLKSILFRAKIRFEKREISGENPKRVTFSHYYGNKTHNITLFSML